MLSGPFLNVLTLSFSKKGELVMLEQGKVRLSDVIPVRPGELTAPYRYTQVARSVYCYDESAYFNT